MRILTHISAQQVEGAGELYIALVVCTTIFLCIVSIAAAVCYCMKQRCDARYKEEIARQNFEKDMMAKEQEALTAKWKHEDDVRKTIWEQEMLKRAAEHNLKNEGISKAADQPSK